MDCAALTNQLLNWLVGCSSNFVADRDCMVEIRIVNPAAGRELFLCRPAVEGQVILRIPLEAMVTPEMCLSLFSPADLPSVSQASPYALICLWLVVQKTMVRSTWKPYIDSLPECYETLLSTPLVTDQSLVTSYVAGKIRQREIDQHWALFESVKEEVERLYDMVVVDSGGEIQSCSKPSNYRDCLQWAFETITSRSCFFPSSRNQWRSDFALVPLLDFANFVEESPVHVEYNVDEKAYLVTALRDMAANETVCFTYGEFDNFHLWLLYGFVFSPNAFDAIPCPAFPWEAFIGWLKHVDPIFKTMSPAKYEHLVQKKRALLAQRSLDLESGKLTASGPNFNLTVISRVFALRPDELAQSWSVTGGEPCACWLSEIATLTFLLSYAVAAIRKIDTIGNPQSIVPQNLIESDRQLLCSAKDALTTLWATECATAVPLEQAKWKQIKSELCT